MSYEERLAVYDSIAAAAGQPTSPGYSGGSGGAGGSGGSGGNTFSTDLGLKINKALGAASNAVRNAIPASFSKLPLAPTISAAPVGTSAVNATKALSGGVFDIINGNAANRAGNSTQSTASNGKLSLSTPDDAVAALNASQNQFNSYLDMAINTFGERNNLTDDDKRRLDMAGITLYGSGVYGNGLEDWKAYGEKQEREIKDRNSQIRDYLTANIDKLDPDAIQEIMAGLDAMDKSAGDIWRGIYENEDLQAWDKARIAEKEQRESEQRLNDRLNNYNAAKDAYDEARSAFTRLTAGGTATPEEVASAQEQIKDAKKTMDAAKQAYEDAGGEMPSFLDRLLGTASGGLKGSLASATDAQRALYEAGQAGRSRANQADIDYEQQMVEQSQRIYDKVLAQHNGDTENGDVEAARNILEDHKRKLEAYQTVERAQPGAASAAAELADVIQQSSAKDLARAKENASGLEKFLVDAGASGIQMLGDAAVGSLTGVGMLPAMAARSFGGGTQEARQAGADIRQQIGFGAANAAVEVLTEKMADGLAGLAGKGAADDVAEEVIRRLASSDEGRTILRSLYGMGGEAVEEAVSSLVNPAIRAIYDNGESAKESYGTGEGRKQLLVDTAYDALVGAALGGVGSAASLVNGQDTAANNELTIKDAGTTAEGQLLNALNVADGRISLDEQLSRERAARARLGVENPVLNVVRTGSARSAAETAAEAPTASAPEITPAAAPAADTAAAEALNTEAQPADNLQTRRTEIQTRLDEIESALNTETDEATIEALYSEGDALMKEAQALDNQIQARDVQQARVNAGEVSTGFGTEKNHIDNRTGADMTSRSVKAFQFDHPELHGYFVDAAQALIDEVQAADMQTTLTAGQKGSAVKRGPVRELMDLGLSKPRVLQCLNDIIANNGQENYADAKRVEKVLSNMMSDGWTDMSRQIHEPNADYIAAKDAINGGVKSDSWEKYLADREWMIETGDATEEQLRAEWEAQNPAETEVEPAAPVAEVNAEATETAQPETPQPVQAAPAEATPTVSEPGPSAPVPENGPAQAPTGTTTAEGTNGTGETAGEAPRAPFTAPDGLNTATRTREGRFSSNTLANNEAAANVPKDQRSRFTYETKSEGQSVAEAASRLATDRSGEVQKLLDAEAWSGAQTDMATQIAKEFYRAGDLESYSSWKKVMNDHAIEGGRGIQAWNKYNQQDGQSAFDKVTDAVNENDSLSPEQKATILRNAKEAADKYDAVLRDVADAKNAAQSSGENAKAPQSLKDLILDIAGKRRTGTIIRGNLTKLLNSQSENVDYLTSLAYNQIAAMSADYTTHRSFAEYVKSFQTLAQLTSIATFNRNILGNVSFGSIVDVLAKDAFGVALDKAVSKATGKRTVAFDRSFFSSEYRKGALDGMQKSALEVALDVDMDGGESANKYGRPAGRTFKMSGNIIERFFSRWEQLLNYSLTTSDKTSRGAIEAENRRGLDALQNSNLTEEEKAAIAEQEADYRLFQNQGTAYKFSKGIHDVANIVGFGGQVNGPLRSGGFGLGDIINTYPGVPANLGVKPLEYSPANIAKGGIELFNLWQNAKKTGNVDASAQYKAVTDIARGLSGVPIIALFGAMFKAGLLKNSDDEEDPDAKALNAAEGQSGIQINLSAALRWLKGEGAEWKNGDTLDSIGYLEPLNAFMGIGSLMASQDDDATLTDYAKSYANGAIQSFLDIPVMSNLANMIDTYQYSAGEGIAEKAGEAALAYAGSSATGFVPSPLRGVAKALDDTYRDTSGENVAESSLNAFKATIPLWRETLPEKLDNFGNPKTYSGNTAERIFNTLINPGDRTTLRDSEAGAFVDQLRAASGDAGVIPDRKAPNRLDFGDGSVKLTPDEKREYQKAYGDAAERYVLEMMDDDLFNTLSPQEQASVIKELYSTAKEQARDKLAASRGSEKRSDTAALLVKTDKPGENDDVPALKEKNLPQYVMYRTAYRDAVKNGNYNVIDDILGRYENLDSNTREVLEAKKPDDMKGLLAFRDAGSGSESYFKVKDAITDAQWLMDTESRTSAHVKMAGLGLVDLSPEEKDKLVESGAYSLSQTGQSTYDILRGYDFTAQNISDWFENADWYSSGKDKTTGEQKPAEANGSLNAYEVATAISKIPGLTESQRSAMYQQFKSALQKDGDLYDTWKSRSYTQALRQSTNYGRITGRDGEAITQPQQASMVTDLAKLLGITG